MSHDLTFYPREGSSLLQRKDFFAFFKGDLYNREGDTINYYNQDTGVYFHLTWYGGKKAKKANTEEEATPAGPRIHFNMNFYRPHTFGLEAAQVLPLLVRRFDLVVNDPQAEGMGEGDFNAEGFLRGWNAGNRFAASAFRQIQSEGETDLSEPLTLPAALNRAYWNWNYRRNQFGQDLFDIEDIDVYVPPIWFCREDEQVRSFVLYPNLIPSAVPKVDYVFVLRNELASPYKKRSKKTPGWVRWDELVAAAPGFEVRCEDPDEDELPHLILFNEEYTSMENPPEDLAKWVISLPKWPGKPENVPPDEILDAELLASS
jgi:hypothetical protein